MPSFLRFFHLIPPPELTRASQPRYTTTTVIHTKFNVRATGSARTTNSQAVTPIAAASNLTPHSPPDSPQARPISTTDSSMAGSCTTYHYSQVPSFSQSLTQISNLRRGKPARQTLRRSRAMRTFGSMQTEYADNVLASVFTWIVLSGFLVLHHIS